MPNAEFVFVFQMWDLSTALDLMTKKEEGELGSAINGMENLLI